MKIRRPSLPVVLLLLAVLLMAFVRVRLLGIPLERDEGEFAYGGQLMLDGIPPYKLFYNMKFPGIYAAYALSMRLFGETIVGVHLGLLVVNLVCVWLLYRLARHFLDVPGAAVAAASYVLLSTSPNVLGLAAHATHFVVAAALGGLLLLLRGEDSQKLALFYWSGFLLALACLMKQPGALFGLFGLCLLVARAVRERKNWSVHWRRILLYSMGLATPIAVTALILWQAGVFDRFWFWTIVYARVHGSVIAPAVAVQQAVRFFQSVPLTADGLFWIMAGFGLVSLVLNKIELPKKLWLLGFFVFSAVAVSLSGFYTSHYFVMLLPALSLFCGQAVGAALRWVGAEKFGVARGLLPAGLFVLAWTLVVFHYREVFSVLTPEQACRTTYPENPFVEAISVGHYIHDHSLPDARIAILGSEPEILFYAHRRSATGYIYTYDFFAPQPYAEQMQQEMIKEIEEARPEYMVFVRIIFSWDVRPDFAYAARSAVLQWMPRFLQSFYEPAGLVLMKQEPEYYWGKDSMNGPQTDFPYISIFKRE